MSARSAVSTPEALIRRARAHQQQHRFDASEREFRRALRLLRGEAALKLRARTLRALGMLLETRGHYRQAAIVLRDAVHASERAFGRDSLDVAYALNGLGMCCKYLARFTEAARVYRRALDIVSHARRPAPQTLATLYHNLGGLEHAAGRASRGEPFARESVRLRVAALGPHHPDVAADKTALAALLDQQQKYAEAERLYREAITIYEQACGPSHPALGSSVMNLAALHQMRGRPRLAERLYRRALAIELAAGGPEHPKVAFCRNNLAALLLSRGRLIEAETLCREALGTFRRHLGARHPNTKLCQDNYAAIRRHADARRRTARRR